MTLKPWNDILSIYKAGVDPFKYRYLAPGGYNASSVETTDENELQTAQWPAEAHHCLEDNI